MATQELANEAFGQIYGLFDRDSVLRYVGKNKSTLENRMNLNTWKVRMDPTSSPLYRYVQQNGGSFDGWTIRPIARITYDQSLLPDALVDAEDECISALRRAGHPLLNKNKAKAPRDRREYMRAWRARNPDYMKRKGREHRERRRVAALAAQAQAEREQAESQ